jgi:23S rRNA (adenine2503-C2)-methyltransferase
VTTPNLVPVNLIGRSSAAIVKLVAPVTDRPFRGRQVAHWVNQRLATSFAEMTNLSLELRDELASRFALDEPRVVDTAASGDGSVKYLFTLADGATIEGVAMCEGRKATLCLSSQAGCAVGCTFCVTGALGAGRNLDPSEIVGQYRVMQRHLNAEVERTNLVFMGMGEPLLNTRNLGRAVDVLAEKISLKRITVSTAGIIPGIEWLARRERRPKLAVSLNAPDQERRQAIMPIAARYPLAELMRVLRSFPLERGRRITFEYVLISSFNDAREDARQVADLISAIPAKVNVIPLNEDRRYFPDLRRPDSETVDGFAAELRDAGITVTVRWSRGSDVAAACGQLRGRQPTTGR